MSEVRFSCACALSHISAIPITDEFTFLFNNCEYKCHRIQAAFLSPTISRILMTEVLASEFRITPNADGDNFQIIMDLIQGRAITLDESNAMFILSVGKQLGNCEMKKWALQFINKEITVGNAVQHLRFMKDIGLNCQAEIEFVAQHLYEIDTNELKTLDVDVLWDVLHSPSLVIPDEDWLFEIALDLVTQGGPQYERLYEAIHFDYLTGPSMMKFIDTFKYADMSGSLWSALCRRLACNVAQAEGKRMSRYVSPYISSRDYEYSGQNPFDGVVAHLTSECGGNIHQKGIVNITASSVKTNEPYRIVDYSSETHFVTQDQRDAFVQVHFLQHQLKLTNYTLKSHSGLGNFFMSWVLEGSNNGIDWIQLDSHENCNDLKGPSLVHTYSCKDAPPMTFFRIQQTGETSSHANYLIIAKMELFGTLYTLV